MVASLSNDVLLDVLCRLGVKDLLRFRCISKSFCSSIDDPGFIKLQLSQSLKTNANLYFILGNKYHFVVDLDSLETAELETSRKLNGSHIELLGSCNGLLALYNDVDEILFWNPSTGKSKILLLPLTEIEFPTWAVCWKFMVFGFGYDPLSDEYKLVQITEFHGEDRRVGSEVKVYSLRTNSWKRINGLPFIMYGRSCGVLANNALHWLVSVNTGSNTILLALDLGTEEYRIVELPGCLDVSFDVVAVGGCLCWVADHWELGIVDIWMMKEYGVKESWTKSISLIKSELGPAFRFVVPLTLSNNGDKILLNIEDKKVVWYDMRSNTSRLIKGVRRSFLDIEMLVQSLVPLNDNGTMIN